MHFQVYKTKLCGDHLIRSSPAALVRKTLDTIFLEPIAIFPLGLGRSNSPNVLVISVRIQKRFT